MDSIFPKRDQTFTDVSYIYQKAHILNYKINHENVYTCWCACGFPALLWCDPGVCWRPASNNSSTYSCCKKYICQEDFLWPTRLWEPPSYIPTKLLKFWSKSMTRSSDWTTTMWKYFNKCSLIFLNYTKGKKEEDISEAPTVNTGGTNERQLKEENKHLASKLDGVGPVDNRPSTD